MSKSSQGFGRDEMTALLGVGMQETLTRPAGWNAKKDRKDDKDVSTLSVAETAALLKEIDAKKQASASVGARLRAKKSNHVPQRHTLLQEQQQMAQQQNQEKSDSEDSEGDIFTHRPTQGKKRDRTEPTILKRHTKAEPEILVKRRRDHTSSDSDSNSEGSCQKPTTGRKRRGESSGSSSDDDRKKRLLAMRRKTQQVSNRPIEEIQRSIDIETSDPERLLQNGPHSHQREQKYSSSDESSKDSDSSEDSSSSEEEELQATKPLFVPKNRRNKIMSQEEKQHEENDRKAKESEREEKRRLSSRILLAKVVAAEATSNNSQAEVDDEAGGATNDPPDDEDPTDPIECEVERDAWEVREILRLFEAEDLREKQVAEAREYARRKQLSDKQQMEEDEAVGRYQKPGKRDEGLNNHMQRYYHRGAFYMDNDEWTTDDVRHKAKEYARAATGEDKIDKSKLPEIMKVKRFGLSGIKYKGLSKDDTTGKQMEMLPIIGKKGRKSA